MGQTLTHGIYLPDEGERNCYNGLAGNWQLLDGAVGTVAEHTTQIAGKANAVHTHTKSDITDFPAYGTTAGTICEGNDSRLSDARTPVAHTHTKSDVTDLLNSNFIPSANNSYDLGSSSYQWNNLYAKNYYYNGTAWGLDQANVWTGDNTYTSTQITIKNDYVARGTIPSVNRNYVLNFTDSNNDTVGMIFQQIRSGSGSYKMTFSLNNGTTDHRINFFGFTDGSSFFIPEVTNTTDLGTSTYKWKSLNGVNPGALSLPNLTANSPATQNPPNGWISIDTTNWNVSGGFGNAYIPASDGWLHINIKDTATNSIFVFATNKYSASVYGNGSQGLDGRLALMMPVLSGVTYAIIITAGSVSEIYTAKFFPCKGNV